MRLSRGNVKINKKNFLDARGAGGAARPALSRIIYYQSIPMHTPSMHIMTINKGNNSIFLFNIKCECLALIKRVNLFYITRIVHYGEGVESVTKIIK